MPLILSIIGGVLFLNGVVYAICIGSDLGVLLTILLGVFLLLWGIFYRKIRTKTQSGILKYLKWMIVTGLVAEALLVAGITFYGLTDTVDYKEDAVIILGAGIHGEKVSSALKQRLDTAVLYLEKKPDALLVVTGGQGTGEAVTEAYAMEKYLLECGVPANKILKEEKATSTNENMLYSKKLLDKRLGTQYKVAIITNHFHIYRGVSYAQKNGFLNPTHVHAGLRWYNLAPCFLRESLAVLKMWILD